ncbi:MAG TPA: rod shape-determining protein MreC [Steroidobacteraceae bacterium]|nr:rod shape-determining protein MreC [Steroidobacteraceae bacterium]
MAAFGSSFDRPLYGRGPSPGLRFVLFALLCLMFMYLDQRGRWTERLRYGLQGLAYPIQWVVNSPSLAWHALGAGFETRGQLRTENEQLRQQQRADEIALLRLKSLEQENQELRGLKAALPALARNWQLAEVISTDPNPLRQRLVINRGANGGAFPNQAVVDSKGVLGQVVRTGPLSSEVLLITDPESGIPVQVLRNGLRTIAVGSGAPNDLLLPYLAVNADIRSGDQLVTSGMGGVYPAGYPVAEVTGISRDDKQLVAQVHARPLAGTGSSRELILLEFEPAHPDAPEKADVASLESQKSAAAARQSAP